MVFQRIVVNALKDHFSTFVEGADLENVSLQLWKGEISVCNLKLKDGAFDFLDLPFKILTGTLGSFKAAIPWKSLKSQPCKVEIKDVFLTAIPLDNSSFSMEEIARRSLKAKFARLDRYDAKKKLEKSGEGSKEDSTWVQRLTAIIVNNLQISVENVHVRFEDARFACGVILKRFDIISTDPEWKSVFLNEGECVGSIFHKLARSNDLSVYLDCGKEAVSNRGAKGHTFIVQPTDILFKVTLNMDTSDLSSPQRKLDVEIFKIGVELTQKQLNMALLLQRAATDMQRLYDEVQALQSYCNDRRLRPLGANIKKWSARPSDPPVRGKCLGWWRYCISKVVVLQHFERHRRVGKARNLEWDVLVMKVLDREQFVSLQRKRIRWLTSPDAKTDCFDEEEATLWEELAGRLSIDDLLVFRRYTEELIGKEDMDAACVAEATAGEEKKKKKKRWFWSKQEDDKPVAGVELSAQERMELFASLNFEDVLREATEESKHPAGYVHTAVGFHVEKLKGCLIREDGSFLVTGEFDLSAGLGLKRDGAFDAVCALKHLLVVDRFTPGTRFPTLVEPLVKGSDVLSAKLSVGHVDALGEEGEDHTTRKRKVALDMTLRPIKCVLYPSIVVEVLQFFSASTIGTASRLAVHVARGLGEKSHSEVLRWLQQRPEFECKISTNGPLLLIPEDPTLVDGRSVVLDCGSLSVYNGEEKPAYRLVRHATASRSQNEAQKWRLEGGNVRWHAELRHATLLLFESNAVDPTSVKSSDWLVERHKGVFLPEFASKCCLGQLDLKFGCTLSALPHSLAPLRMNLECHPVGDCVRLDIRPFHVTVMMKVLQVLSREFGRLSPMKSELYQGWEQTTIVDQPGVETTLENPVEEETTALVQFHVKKLTATVWQANDEVLLEAHVDKYRLDVEDRSLSRSITCSVLHMSMEDGTGVAVLRTPLAPCLKIAVRQVETRHLAEQEKNGFGEYGPSAVLGSVLHVDIAAGIWEMQCRPSVLGSAVQFLDDSLFAVPPASPAVCDDRRPARASPAVPSTRCIGKLSRRVMVADTSLSFGIESLVLKLCPDIPAGSPAVEKESTVPAVVSLEVADIRVAALMAETSPFRPSGDLSRGGWTHCCGSVGRVRLSKSVVLETLSSPEKSFSSSCLLLQCGARGFPGLRLNYTDYGCAIHTVDEGIRRNELAIIVGSVRAVLYKPLLVQLTDFLFSGVLGNALYGMVVLVGKFSTAQETGKQGDIAGPSLLSWKFSGEGVELVAPATLQSQYCLLPQEERSDDVGIAVNVGRVLLGSRFSSLSSPQQFSGSVQSAAVTALCWAPLQLDKDDITAPAWLCSTCMDSIEKKEVFTRLSFCASGVQHVIPVPDLNLTVTVTPTPVAMSSFNLPVFLAMLENNILYAVPCSASMFEVHTFLPACSANTVAALQMGKTRCKGCSQPFTPLLKKQFCRGCSNSFCWRCLSETVFELTRGEACQVCVSCRDMCASQHMSLTPTCVAQGGGFGERAANGTSFSMQLSMEHPLVLLMQDAENRTIRLGLFGLGASILCAEDGSISSVFALQDVKLVDESIQCCSAAMWTESLLQLRCGDDTSGVGLEMAVTDGHTSLSLTLAPLWLCVPPATVQTLVSVAMAAVSSGGGQTGPVNYSAESKLGKAFSISCSPSEQLSLPDMSLTILCKDIEVTVPCFEHAFQSTRGPFLMARGGINVEASCGGPKTVATVAIRDGGVGTATGEVRLQRGSRLSSCPAAGKWKTAQMVAAKQSRTIVEGIEGKAKSELESGPGTRRIRADARIGRPNATLEVSLQPADVECALFAAEALVGPPRAAPAPVLSDHTETVVRERVLGIQFCDTAFEFTAEIEADALVSLCQPESKDAVSIRLQSASLAGQLRTLSTFTMQTGRPLSVLFVENGGAAPDAVRIPVADRDRASAVLLASMKKQFVEFAGSSDLKGDIDASIESCGWQNLINSTFRLLKEDSAGCAIALPSPGEFSMHFSLLGTVGVDIRSGDLRSPLVDPCSVHCSILRHANLRWSALSSDAHRVSEPSWWTFPQHLSSVNVDVSNAVTLQCSEAMLMTTATVANQFLSVVVAASDDENASALPTTAIAGGDALPAELYCLSVGVKSGVSAQILLPRTNCRDSFPFLFEGSSDGEEQIPFVLAQNHGAVLTLGVVRSSCSELLHETVRAKVGSFSVVNTLWKDSSSPFAVMAQAPASGSSEDWKKQAFMTLAIDDVHPILAEFLASHLRTAYPKLPIDKGLAAVSGKSSTRLSVADAQFSDLRVGWNSQALMLVFNAIFRGLTPPEASPVLSREGSAVSVAPQAEAATDRVLLASVEAAGGDAVFNKDGMQRRLLTLSVTGLEGSAMIGVPDAGPGGPLRIKGRVGKIFGVSHIYESDFSSFQDVYFAGLEPIESAKPVVVFDLQSDSGGGGAPVIPTLSLSLGNVRMLYLQQPLLELVDYFSNGVLAAVMQKTASQAEMLAETAASSPFAFQIVLASVQASIPALPAGGLRLDSKEYSAMEEELKSFGNVLFARIDRLAVHSGETILQNVELELSGVGVVVNEESLFENPLTCTGCISQPAAQDTAVATSTLPEIDVSMQLSEVHLALDQSRWKGIMNVLETNLANGPDKAVLKLQYPVIALGGRPVVVPTNLPLGCSHCGSVFSALATRRFRCSKCLLAVCATCLGAVYDTTIGDVAWLCVSCYDDQLAAAPVEESRKASRTWLSGKNERRQQLQYGYGSVQPRCSRLQFRCECSTVRAKLMLAPKTESHTGQELVAAISELAFEFSRSPSFLMVSKAQLRKIAVFSQQGELRRYLIQPGAYGSKTDLEARSSNLAGMELSLSQNPEEGTIHVSVGVNDVLVLILTDVLLRVKDFFLDGKESSAPQAVAVEEVLEEDVDEAELMDNYARSVQALGVEQTQLRRQSSMKLSFCVAKSRILLLEDAMDLTSRAVVLRMSGSVHYSLDEQKFSSMHTVACAGSYGLAVTVGVDPREVDGRALLHDVNGTGQFCCTLHPFSKRILAQQLDMKAGDVRASAGLQDVFVIRRVIEGVLSQMLPSSPADEEELAATIDESVESMAIREASAVIPQKLSFRTFHRPRRMNWLHDRKRYVEYTVGFSRETMHLNFSEVEGRVVVHSFPVPAEGGVGDAEMNGQISIGDCLIEVNGVDISTLAFADVMLQLQFAKSAAAQSMAVDDSVKLKFRSYKAEDAATGATSELSHLQESGLAKTLHKYFSKLSGEVQVERVVLCFLDDSVADEQPLLSCSVAGVHCSVQESGHLVGSCRGTLSTRAYFAREARWCELLQDSSFEVKAVLTPVRKWKLTMAALSPLSLRVRPRLLGELLASCQRLQKSVESDFQRTSYCPYVIKNQSGWAVSVAVLSPSKLPDHFQHKLIDAASSSSVSYYLPPPSAFCTALSNKEVKFIEYVTVASGESIGLFLPPSSLVQYILPSQLQREKRKEWEESTSGERRVDYAAIQVLSRGMLRSSILTLPLNAQRGTILELKSILPEDQREEFSWCGDIQWRFGPHCG